MDYKHQRKISLLEGEEECFSNKVSSSDSIISSSSRTLYYRSNAEGVPFNWEMQPGTPKELPKEEVIPPLSPPPALLSLGLPKPCIDIEYLPNNNKTSIFKSKIMFWKKQSNKKIQGFIKKLQSIGSKENNNVIVIHVNDFVNMEFCSSDGEEFMASPRNSSSTSSSSSSNSSLFSKSLSSRGQSPSVKRKVDGLLYGGCSPWHIAPVLFHVARKIW